MAQELMNMAGFQGGPAAAFAGMGMDESLSDGIGGGYPLLRYKGKVWRIQVRGEEHTFVDERGYPSPFIDVIILRQAQNKSKAYFEHYEEGSKDAPVCTAADGIVPDLGVLHKQSETCAMCPRNVFKLNEKGIKVKECGDAKRLSVIPMPKQTEKLLGAPLIEPVFLRVPAASLQGLSQMGDATKRMGYAYFSFITRIDFDPDKAYPKMRFSAIQRLSDKEAAKVLELRDDPMSFRICGGDTTGSAPRQIQAPLAPAADTGLVAGAQSVASPQQWEAAAEAAKKDHYLGDQPSAVQTHLDNEKAALAFKLEADRQARLAAIRKEADELEKAAAPAKTLELKVNPTPPTPPASIDTGLGGTTAPASAAASQVATPSGTPQTTSAAPAATQTVAASIDTGEPDQADSALDDAIAALLPR
jgi:hypothetical protein